MFQDEHIHLAVYIYTLIWHSWQESNKFRKNTFDKLNKCILQFAKIHFSGKIHGFDKIQNFNGCSVQSPMSASCHTLCVPTKYISWDSAFLETLYINQIYILNYCEEGQSKIVVILRIKIFSAFLWFSSDTLNISGGQSEVSSDILASGQALHAIAIQFFPL